MKTCDTCGKPVPENTARTMIKDQIVRFCVSCNYEREQRQLDIAERTGPSISEQSYGAVV